MLPAADSRIRPSANKRFDDPVEGARAELHLSAGPLCDVLQDGVAVLFAVHQRQEDMEQRRREGEQRVRVTFG